MTIRRVEGAKKAKNPAGCGVFRGYGRGRIRTCEGISHQIYSLTRLAASVHARVIRSGAEIIGTGATLVNGGASRWAPAAIAPATSSRDDSGDPIDGYFAGRMSSWKSSARGLVLLTVMVSCVKPGSVLGNQVVSWMGWRLGS